MATQARGLFTDTVIPIVLETIRIFPDGLVIALGLFSVLTLSAPYGIFFGTMVETGFLYNLLRSTSSYLFGQDTTYSKQKFSEHCRSGFTFQSDYTTLSTFGKDAPRYGFPSYPLFMLTTASSYLFSTLNALSKELDALGPAFSQRYYISLIFLSFLLFVFAGFRLLYGCEGFGTVILTIIVGLLTGIILVEQNKGLFGMQGINLIGVPLLRSRTAAGQPLYICPK